MNKKLMLLAAVLLLLPLSACGTLPGETDRDPEKPVVTVTTSFLRDMVEELAGDEVNLELIIPAGEDPHVYLAKPQDLIKLQDADLLLYHGLHFEGKMVEALEPTGVAVTRTFDPSKVGELQGEDGEVTEDPHFWFDIGLYKEATKTAAEELIKLLPEHRREIEENLEDYLARLDELDRENRAALDTIPKESRYLITPHDAFNYFSRAYDIGVRAPQGISTNSEVANKDVEETANFIVKHKIKAIFAESTSDPARMEKLRETCLSKGHDVKVVGGEGEELFSDSLAPKGKPGDTYIDMYRHNVRLITENLK